MDDLYSPARTSRTHDTAHSTGPEYVPQPVPVYNWPATVGPTWSKKIMPWLEHFWLSKKRFPTDSELVQRFGFDEQELIKFHESKYMQNCFDARGIIPPSKRGTLNAAQVAAISLLANVSDTRSEKAKLAAIGVTTEQYHGWMQDDYFKSELNARVDEMLGNLKPAANAALAKQVQKGQFQAIKFYFELTGQSKTPEQINLENALVAVVDILERNIRDPQLLERIGVELHNVLNPERPKALPSVSHKAVSPFDPPSSPTPPTPPVASSPVAEVETVEAEIVEESDNLRDKFLAFQESLREAE